jgi:tRNA (guanine9-N1)-methyltransferase
MQSQTDDDNDNGVGGGAGGDPSSTFSPLSSNSHNNASATAHSLLTTKPSTMSKNQRKKQARYEKSIAIKRQRKQQTKEVKRLKAIKEGRDLVAERTCQLHNEAVGIGKAKRDAKWQSLFTQRGGGSSKSFRVCLDCSFESQMTDKECNSLALQIRYVYAVNRRSTHPVHVDICGLGGRKQQQQHGRSSGSKTRAQLENVDGFPDRWKDRAFHCHDDDVEVLYSNFIRCDDDDDDDAKKKTEEVDDDRGSNNNNDAAHNDFDDTTTGKNEHDGCEEENSLTVVAFNDTTDANNVNDDDTTVKSSGKLLSQQLPPNHKFVYLTGDSPHTLTTLNDNTTYIIGGIVDRNRLKLATLHRAEYINTQLPQLNVMTARLPLEEYLDFKGSTRILTCNHVFEILLHYRANGYTDWRTAIMAVLPCRKDVEEKKTQNARWSPKEDDEDNNEEEESEEDKLTNNDE